jgi:valyl-tRNA synthetase
MNKKLVSENRELKAKLEKSLTQKIEGMIKTQQESEKERIEEEKG